MKLSKKILGAVLCGLVVVGGSNASLVKANAQTLWSEGVRLETHAKGMPGFTDRWLLNLEFVDGKLQLNGRTNIPGNITFHDTFTFGWRERFGTRYHTEVVRTCWKADAGDALKRLEDRINKAGIKEGDVIFIHGESYKDSVTFCGPYLIKQPQQSRISYNTYDDAIYKNFDQHHTAFYVTKKGLEVVKVGEYL